MVKKKAMFFNFVHRLKNLNSVNCCQRASLALAWIHLVFKNHYGMYNMLWSYDTVCQQAAAALNQDSIFHLSVFQGLDDLSPRSSSWLQLFLL